MKNYFLKLFSLIAFLSTSPYLSAGSAVAITKCVSASGRTKVEVSNQDQMQFLNIQFSIDNESLSYAVDSDDGQGTVNAQGAHVLKLKDKVYTVYAKATTPNTYQEVTLWALPATINKVNTDEGERFTFKANIQGTDPRAAFNGEPSKLIEVNCTHTYSI